MAQIIPFPQKGKPVNPEVESERLRHRREGKGALSFGESSHVAEVSTGEEVEIDPVRFNSVHDIYKVIERNFKRKDAASREQALGELQQSLGVEVSTDTPAMSETLEAEPEVGDESDELKQLIHQLAEDIYDALENCRASLAAIKPESISGSTASRLDSKGDANFIVAAGEGEKLLHSLEKQDSEFKMVRKNDYGFVIENEELGFRVMFIYQERLHRDGTPKHLEELRDETTPDEDATQDDTVRIQNQKSANQSNLGQGGSLAA